MKPIILGFTLASLAAGAGAQTTANPVVVTVTAKACEPNELTVPAGSVTFQIVNKSTRALEWEILKGVMVVDERENIAPGFKQRMTTRLEPGEYDITCGLLSNPRGKLIVRNASGGTESVAAKPTEMELIGPAAEYRVWSVGESAALAEQVKALSAAIVAGSLDDARPRWSEAHFRYLRLMPAAALPNEFAILANGLYTRGATAGLEPAAATLVRNVEDLRAKVRAATPSADAMIASAIAAARTMAGDGPSDADARLQGISRLLELLRPLTSKADPVASGRIDAAEVALRAAVEKVKGSLGKTQPDRTPIEGAATALAGELAGLPGVLGLKG